MTEIQVKKHFPKELAEKYEFHQWKHACAILKSDFPSEWKDLVAMLSEFLLLKSWIIKGGGNKTELAKWIDAFLGERGWVEKQFATSVIVDENKMESPTHRIDCYKNRIALELEWNNKDPFFDRDLNNFRLLFDLRAISVALLLLDVTNSKKSLINSDEVLLMACQQHICQNFYLVLRVVVVLVVRF